MTPEQEAREIIDGQLAAAGWVVQDVAALDLSASRGVAVREMRSRGLLRIVGGKTLGEGKKEGISLSSVYPFGVAIDFVQNESQAALPKQDGKESARVSCPDRAKL